jgi:hypothetical protein
MKMTLEDLLRGLILVHLICFMVRRVPLSCSYHLTCFYHNVHLVYSCLYFHNFNRTKQTALTDADKFGEFGHRILINDMALWPMAKGCDPPTRECYFESLTKCKLADVDPIDSPDTSAVAVLENANDEYDRNARTLYSSRSWFRPVRKPYSWTGLPGEGNDHSDMAVTAAALAYYLRPKPSLQKEINERLKESIPANLNPDRTIGIPIRRSDKCYGHNLEGSAAGELDCPPLSSYLDGVKSFLAFDPLVDTVIVTSEDKSACDEFLQLLKTELPQLRVVRNVGDVQQGTGSGTKIDAYTERATNEKVVASALTSMVRNCLHNCILYVLHSFVIAIVLIHLDSTFRCELATSSSRQSQRGRAQSLSWHAFMAFRLVV